MAVSRWDPFRDLMTIQGELNRLFGKTYGDAETVERGRADWAPAMDVFETPDRYVVSVELPGIRPDDVEISVEESTLTIQGERKFTSETSEENYHRVERRYGSFLRSLTLPPTADAERIEASFDQGLLRIEVPKKEEAKPKKISVKATGRGA